jgi:hypothetical protein
LATRARVKIKVKVKVKVKRHPKTGKGTGKPKTVTKTKTKTKKVTKTILVGSVIYRLAAGRSQPFTLKLSKAAVKLLAKARHGRLFSQVLAGGAVITTVTLLGPKHKKHKTHKHHPKHKKHKKK